MTPSPDRAVAGLVGDRYEITGLIATGGMGSVYRAHDTVLDRTVALKVLKAGMDDEAFARRFKSEATNAARLSHQNIVQVYDFGSSDDDRPYMAMEYVDGQSLREVLTVRGALPPGMAASIASQVAGALEHARRAGIVHRDVKPENILITTDGRVKMADFGLSRALAESKVTQAEVIMGTAHYLAPEQVEGEPSDHRSDIYALGIVLYEMLAGRPPFQGDTPVVIAYKRVAEDVPSVLGMNPTVPRELDAVIQRATARAPEDRYHSPADLAADLRAAVPRSDTGELSILVHHTEAIPIVGQETVAVIKRDRTLNKRRRKRRRLIVLGLVLSLIGIAIVTAQNNLAKEYVPSVVGLSQTSAQENLIAAGFQVRSSLQNHPTVPQGDVISQDPASGLAREGSFVNLTVSLGPKEITVPDVIGKRFAVAEELLTAQGFHVTREDVNHPEIPKLHVIARFPQDAQLFEGTTVKLQVSKGPEQIRVPNLIGDDRASALADLEALEFEVVVVEEISETVAKDLVIRTNPEPGARIAKGSSIRLIVSKGPPPVEVPDLECMSRKQAQDTLAARGLVVDFVGGEARVVDQDPAAGSTIPRGSTVTAFTGPGNSC